MYEVIVVLASDSRGRHYVKILRPDILMTLLNDSHSFCFHICRNIMSLWKLRGCILPHAETQHLLHPHKTTEAPQAPRRSVTVIVEAAQEFRLLHNFTDVAGRAAAFLCLSRGETRPSVTIFG